MFTVMPMSNKPITTAEQLVQIYINAEKKLTDIIQAKARASSPAAYERSLLKQIDDELRKLRVTSAKSVTELIEHFYESGLQQLVEQLAQVGENRTYNMFSKLNRRQIEIIARNTTGNFNKAIKMIGRRTQDTVRKITLEATTEKLTTGQTIRQMQKNLAKAFESEHLTCVEYSNGAKMPISKYAEMTARSTTAEAQNSSQFVQAKDWGYDLVKMTYHSPTCEVCAKYQGRVYATTKQAANGKYRDKDGKRLKFPYLYDTVLVKGYDTVHPNCRHRFSVYPARAYTTEELKKASQNSMREFTDDRSDTERKAYAKEQADKRRKNENLKQYEKLKAMFPDDAPKSFAGFVRMKNSKSERYKQLINDSRTVTRLANAGNNDIINITDDVAENKARFLYSKMSRNERTDVIQRGQKVEKPVFSYDRKDNQAMSNLQKVKKEPNTFDVMTHGSPDVTEFFKQDFPEGDIRGQIDPYTMSCILKGRKDYKTFIKTCKENNVEPTLRLLSCNTGNTTNSGNCFAQLLANELGIKVQAPDKTLYVFPDGMFSIGLKKSGEMKLFYPRK